MKQVLFLVLVLFTQYSISTVIAGNNIDANIPEDVAAFKALHVKDDWVLFFFHNGADSKDAGFFDALFGLFGAKSDLDEEYQALIAEKFPIMEIDTQIDALKNVPQDYQVSTLPYLIAYHKNKEIWREMPSMDSANIIENLIKEEDNLTPVLPPAHPTPNEIKQQKISHTAKPSPAVLNSGPKPVADYVDPFNPNKHYKVDPSKQYDPDYGHMFAYDRVGVPGAAISYPTSYPASSYPTSSYPITSPSSSRVVKDHLQPTVIGTPPKNIPGVSNRKILQGKDSGNFASNKDLSSFSYGPAEVKGEYTVRKYNSDKNKK